MLLAMTIEKTNQLKSFNAECNYANSTLFTLIKLSLYQNKLEALMFLL